MIELEDVPELRQPRASSRPSRAGTTPARPPRAAVEHLVDVWDAEAVAALDPEDYYDFQVNRPRVVARRAVAARIIWRTTRILVARRAGPRTATSSSSRASSRRSAGGRSRSS